MWPLRRPRVLGPATLPRAEVLPVADLDARTLDIYQVLSAHTATLYEYVAGDSRITCSCGAVVDSPFMAPFSWHMAEVLPVTDLDARMLDIYQVLSAHQATLYEYVNGDTRVTCSCGAVVGAPFVVPFSWHMAEVLAVSPLVFDN